MPQTLISIENSSFSMSSPKPSSPSTNSSSSPSAPATKRSSPPPPPPPPPPPARATTPPPPAPTADATSSPPAATPEPPKPPSLYDSIDRVPVKYLRAHWRRECRLGRLPPILTEREDVRTEDAATVQRFTQDYVSLLDEILGRRNPREDSAVAGSKSLDGAEAETEEVDARKEADRDSRKAYVSSLKQQASDFSQECSDETQRQQLELRRKRAEEEKRRRLEADLLRQQAVERRKLIEDELERRRKESQRKLDEDNRRQIESLNRQQQQQQQPETEEMKRRKSFREQYAQLENRLSSQEINRERFEQDFSLLLSVIWQNHPAQRRAFHREFHAEKLQKKKEADARERIKRIEMQRLANERREQAEEEARRMAEEARLRQKQLMEREQRQQAMAQAQAQAQAQVAAAAQAAVERVQQLRLAQAMAHHQQTVLAAQQQQRLQQQQQQRSSSPGSIVLPCLRYCFHRFGQPETTAFPQTISFGPRALRITFLSNPSMHPPSPPPVSIPRATVRALLVCLHRNWIGWYEPGTPIDSLPVSYLCANMEMIERVATWAPVIQLADGVVVRLTQTDDIAQRLQAAAEVKTLVDQTLQRLGRKRHAQDASRHPLAPPTKRQKTS